MDALQLIQPHVAAACTPLLRQFVAVAFFSTEQELHKLLQAEPNETDAHRADSQIARLLLVKQLLLALQVCSQP
jgi:hypothetical protein